MSLPIIKNASFSVKIKEISKPIKIRPMVLFEHKSIQAATDMNDDSDVVNVIADITSACTDGVISSTSVPLYVLNYIFLQLYMNSVENVVSARYTCRALKKDESGELLVDEETNDNIICNSSIDVNIPLSMATIEYPPSFDELSVVKISDTVTLHLKCLTLSQTLDIDNLKENIIEKIRQINELNEDDEEYEQNIKVLTDEVKNIKNVIKDTYSYYSVDKIEDSGNFMYPEKDFNQAEFIEWINNCPSSSLVKTEKFYENAPDIVMDLKVVCGSCNNTEIVKLRGLKDFFS